jgi:hypothetical protein
MRLFFKFVLFVRAICIKKLFVMFVTLAASDKVRKNIHVAVLYLTEKRSGQALYTVKNLS